MRSSNGHYNRVHAGSLDPDLSTNEPGAVLMLRQYVESAKRAVTLGVALCAALAAASANAQTAARATPEAWRAIVAAAQKEGRVVMYHATAPAVADRVKADFEKAYPGISFEWQRGNSGAISAKLDQERVTGADGADVAITTEFPWFRNRAKDNELKPLVGPATAGWPGAHLYEGSIAVIALEPAVMMYNTNLVKTPITSYRDALRPEFRGKIGMLDLTGTLMVSFYDWLEKTNGADYLVALAAQQPKIYISVVPGAQSAAAGEFAIAHYVNMSTAAAMLAQGAPVKIVFPQPTFSIRWPMGAVAWSKRPNAALVLTDYLMSVRGQTAWNGGGESASPLPNIPGSQDNKTLNAVDLAPYTPEIVKAYTTKWNGLFKK